MKISSAIDRRYMVAAGCLMVPAALLGGCVNSPNAGTTPGQIIADINGLITALGQVNNALSVTQPGLIPAPTVVQINALLGEAATLASNLSATVAGNVAAPIVNQIEEALGTAIRVLSAIPAIPPPYSGILAAAGVLLPILGQFVQQYLPKPGVGRAAAPSPVAAAAARRTIGVPTVAR